MVGLDKDDEQQMLFHLNKIRHQADGIFLSQSHDGGIFGFFLYFLDDLKLDWNVQELTLEYYSEISWK